jgi:hypothetical protein
MAGRKDKDKETHRIDMSETYQELDEKMHTAEYSKDPEEAAKNLRKKGKTSEDQAGASRHGYVGGSP